MSDGGGERAVPTMSPRLLWGSVRPPGHRPELPCLSHRCTGVGADIHIVDLTVCVSHRYTGVGADIHIIDLMVCLSHCYTGVGADIHIIDLMVCLSQCCTGVGADIHIIDLTVCLHGVDLRLIFVTEVV